MKVLIADDDGASRLMLACAVEELGHDIVVADDGDSAWALLQDDVPEVLITDWQMPGVDGLELTRRVRAQPHGRYTYIILATGLADRTNVLRGMHAGVDDYLVKPLDPFDLETRLIAARRVTALHADLDRYRARLAGLANTDPLTTLRNRQTLDIDLAALHTHSQRDHLGYCLVMCDIDAFKAYNDSCGHQAGDDVLQQIGTILATGARDTDTVYRYGGEEFLLLLADHSQSDGCIVAERLRAAVAELAITHSALGPSAVVTMSFGVAAHRPGDTSTVREVVGRADAALYRAKASGKNVVVPTGTATRDEPRTLHRRVVSGGRS